MNLKSGNRIAYLLSFAGILIFLISCERLIMIGKEYREKLVYQVERARDDQEDVKKQFRSTLEEFASLVDYEGGDLQAKYEDLKSQYDYSKEQAEKLKNRINAIETVSSKLFDEWEEELDLYESDKLRRSSQEKLRKTKDRYNEFIRSMKRAAEKMEPVLSRFNDQVLFLKHNLNANAIASLEGTVVSLESEVAQLVEELEKSIAEANEFIKEMGIEE